MGWNLSIGKIDESQLDALVGQTCDDGQRVGGVGADSWNGGRLTTMLYELSHFNRR